MRPPSIRQLKQECDEFNRSVSIGDPVYVTLDSGEKVFTRTRSAAQVLSGHTAVVFVDDISGAYLLARVRPASAEPAEAGIRILIEAAQRIERTQLSAIETVLNAIFYLRTGRYPFYRAVNRQVDAQEEPFADFAPPIFPDIFHETSHPFVPVASNRYCGQCGAGRLHAIHTSERPADAG